MPGAPALVTVLIPACNAERTIGRALDCALAQDYPATEIIVVDDGSIDATSDVVAGYQQPRIRLLRLPKNLGECGAMNEGILAAAGEYIAFLDADDEWLPGKLSRQIAALEHNPKAIMATCGCRFMDDCGNLRKEFGRKPQGVAKDQIWRCLLAATCIAKPCVVARASAFRQVGLFDTKLRVAGDQDMWIRLATAGEVEFIDEYLTLAHDTPGSLTKVHAKDEDKYGLEIIHRHIAIQRKNLSDEEIRHILCTRYTALGRNVYRAGRVWRGGRLLVKAIMLGADKGENLWYLATASPPAQLAKAMLRPKTGATAVRQNPLPRHSPGQALLAPGTENLMELPAGPPILIVAVDLEAEFDWFGPRLRTHHSVRNVGEQALAHKIFDNFGIRPTYLVDYAAATRANGYGLLREWAAARTCEIGAHLQVWENPPFVEELGERTSYSHNLPAWLQKEKLRRLTEAIGSNIGVRPVVYRAGRYGIGEEMARILRSLGYLIDMSVLPGIDLRRQHGPDFRRVFHQPYWFGRDRDLLEIPLTAGFCGLLSSPALPQALAVDLYDRLSRPAMLRLHGPGFFARLGLLERITLTPEGISIAEMKRLTRSILGRGHRVLSLNYHSSSLLPGYTPYVRNAGDRDRFLAGIASYLEMFFGEFQGIAMTPGELRAALLAARHPAGQEARAASPAT
jgi:glycosyltransferase involved in cell wall biosynthesis